MLLGLVRGTVRGGIAWMVGYVLTLVLVGLGLVERSGRLLGAAARAYLDAHAVPPDGSVPLLLVAVPVLVVAGAGYRVGRATRTGLLGRLKARLQSLRGTELNRATQAAAAAALLAVGYAIVSAIAALVGAGGPVGALVGGLAYGLVVGVPAAVVGAVR